MGSFIATPTHGGGSYNTVSSYGKPGCAKKKPSYSVASRSRAPSQVVRNEPRSVRPEKAQVAHVQRETSKPKASVARRSETVAVAAIAADSSGLTGSKALVQTDNAATQAAADAVVAVVSEPTAPNQTSEASTVAATTETAAVAASEVAPASDVQSSVKTEAKIEEPAKDVGCKKFIPSVGVTIDVGCEK